MPLEEYKLDNLRLEQLMNALERCLEVDSVRQLRMVNYEQMIASKDSVILNQSKQITITQSTISQLQDDVNLQLNKKTAWRNVSLISLAVFALKLFVF